MARGWTRCARATCVAALLALTGCAGVAPGSADTGYVVWGYVQEGTTQAVTGARIVLLDVLGNPVQEVTTDWMGKYTFAYHPPGAYAIAIGDARVPATITDGDQRLDIDTTSGSRVGFGDRLLQGLVQVAEQAGPPSCSGSVAAAGAGGSQPVERDASLVGSWSRVESISSSGGVGYAAMSTRMSLLICQEGTYVRTVGDTVGGGAGWSAESRGSDSTRGRWRTEGGMILIQSSFGGWEPYARYYVEGGSLMLTFDNGQREVWHR